MLFAGINVSESGFDGNVCVHSWRYFSFQDAYAFQQRFEFFRYFLSGSSYCSGMYIMGRVHQIGIEGHSFCWRCFLTRVKSYRIRICCRSVLLLKFHFFIRGLDGWASYIFGCHGFQFQEQAKSSLVNVAWSFQNLELCTDCAQVPQSQSPTL